MALIGYRSELFKIFKVNNTQYSGTLYMEGWLNWTKVEIVVNEHCGWLFLCVTLCINIEDKYLVPQDLFTKMNIFTP